MYTTCESPVVGNAKLPQGEGAFVTLSCRFFTNVLGKAEEVAVRILDQELSTSAQHISFSRPTFLEFSSEGIGVSLQSVSYSVNIWGVNLKIDPAP